MCVLFAYVRAVCVCACYKTLQVCGFEDLSPLDQKALLRRTVSELVMLGFARASIPYAGAVGTKKNKREGEREREKERVREMRIFWFTINC